MLSRRVLFAGLTCLLGACTKNAYVGKEEVATSGIQTGDLATFTVGGKTSRITTSDAESATNCFWNVKNGEEKTLSIQIQNKAARFALVMPVFYGDDVDTDYPLPRIGEANKDKKSFFMLSHQVGETFSSFAASGADLDGFSCKVTTLLTDLNISGNISCTNLGRFDSTTNGLVEKHTAIGEFRCSIVAIGTRPERRRQPSNPTTTVTPTPTPRPSASPAA